MTIREMILSWFPKKKVYRDADDFTIVKEMRTYKSGRVALTYFKAINNTNDKRVMLMRVSDGSTANYFDYSVMKQIFLRAFTNECDRAISQPAQGVLFE